MTLVERPRTRSSVAKAWLPFAMAAVTFMSASTATATLIYQDSTFRTINETNYTAYDLGAGSAFQNTSNQTVLLRWTMRNFNTNSSNGSSYFGLHLWQGANEGLMVGKAGGGYTAYSGFCGQRGSFTDNTNPDDFFNFLLKSSNPEPGQTYENVGTNDVTTVLMYLWLPGNSAYGAECRIWLNPDFTAADPWGQTDRETVLYTDTPFTKILFRESGNGNGVEFGDLRFGSYFTGVSFADMGFAVVPEPSTYAMALAGLACGGFSMWRRRKRA